MFVSSLAMAQTNRVDAAAAGIAEGVIKGANANQNLGATTVFFNPDRKVEGSVFLFKEWNNYTIIHSNDGQKFSLKNINLNIEQNAFQSKIGQDSLFTFNINNIERFIVNGKTFKNYYSKGENRIFQEVYTGSGFQILKGFNVTLVKGSANPMLNRSTDKYVKKEYYFLRKNDLITSFKLKKKSLMKLVDEEEAKKILDYVKKQ